MACETVVHGHCTWRGENFLKGLGEEVAKRYVPVVVKTTWHNGSVGKHSYLVTKGIAESLIGGIFIALTVGPLEHVIKFKVYVRCKTPAVVTLGPRTREIFFQQNNETLIGAVVTALVPQAQYYYYTTRGRLTGKLHYIAYIILNIVEPVALVGMHGNLHLMGHGVNDSPGLVEQCAVGGEHGNKTLCARRNDILWQVSMQQRFAHEVKIEELDLPLQAVGEKVEFCRQKGVFVSFGLWTEETIEIAYVGYLKIAACYHGTPLH